MNLFEKQRNNVKLKNEDDSRSDDSNTDKVIEEMLNSRSDEEDNHQKKNDAHMINESSKKLLEPCQEDDGNSDFSLSEHRHRSAKSIKRK